MWGSEGREASMRRLEVVVALSGSKMWVRTEVSFGVRGVEGIVMVVDCGDYVQLGMIR